MFQKKILSRFPRFKRLTEIFKRFYYGDVSINVTHNDILNIFCIISYVIQNRMAMQHGKIIIRKAQRVMH